VYFLTKFQDPTLSCASVAPGSEVHPSDMLVLLMIRN